MLGQVAELDALCGREAERVIASRAVLNRFRKTLLSKRGQASLEFLRSLLHTTGNYLKLSDSFLMEMDFAPLPGDELKVPDAVSLKRLRKQYRKLDVEVRVSA